MAPRLTSSLTLLILVASLGIISPSRADLSGEILARVNALRAIAGMSALSPSEPLDQAARNHALYLAEFDAQIVRPRQSAHQETPGYPGFTGKTPQERAAYTGYANKHVLENVSEGNPDLNDSLTGLMSGIYHRFAFLDFLVDEIGSAVAYRRYVYELGRSDLENMCHARPEQAKLQTAVDCAGIIVTERWLEALCKDLPQNAVYHPPYPERCPNGQLLDKLFIQQLCSNPPADIKYSGRGGRYYSLCNDRLKVKAGWFERVCASPGPAHFPGNGKYYEKCGSEPVAVHANWLDQQCRDAPASGRFQDSGRYSLPCNSDFAVRKEYIDQLNQARYDEDPQVVLWPPNEWDKTPTYFFGEIPNPVPGLPNAGYPLSIQFNPGKIQSAEVSNARLVDLDSPQLTDIPLQRLDQLTDTNHQLTETQFAWFPRHPLLPEHRYKMTVDAIIDNNPQTIIWHFKTTAY